MKVDRTQFLTLAAALASACGPATPPPDNATNPGPALSQPADPPPTPSAPSDAVPAAVDPNAVEGEDACDVFVPSPCSESAGPRERCRNEARSRTSDNAGAGRAFLDCVRSASASLPRGDAACAEARQTCDQVAMACDQTDVARRACHEQAAPACMNPAAIEGSTQCFARCSETHRLDGCSSDCEKIAAQLQACVGKCGNPATAMEACAKAKCEAQERASEACRARQAQCTIPPRCATIDIPACQAGHAAIDQCRSR